MRLRSRETERARWLDRCPAGPCVHWGRCGAKMTKGQRVLLSLTLLMALVFPASGALAAAGEGLGNRTYEEDELWEPVAILRSDGAQYLIQDQRYRAYGRAFMADGYLNLIWALDAGTVGRYPRGIDVWDVSDPYNPSLVQRWSNEELRQAHNLGLWNRDGQIVLVAQGRTGVVFFDVTHIGTSLPVLGKLELPFGTEGSYKGAWWVSVQAPYVYVATKGGGLSIVDATDPTAPRLVEQLPTGALGGISPASVFAVGNLLVLADSHSFNYATLDISDPANPSLLATIAGASGYSHLFTAGLVLSSGGIHSAPGMYVHRVGHDGSFQYGGEAGENLPEDGGYGSYQDGHFFSGFSNKVAKFTIDPPAQVGAGTSGIDDRDEDFAQPLGNLLLASSDNPVGTALIPHQTAPDTTGPEVVWQHPAAGATGLALTTRIGVSLSDEVAVESLTPAHFRVTRPDDSVVAGQLSVNQTDVNFFPDAPLAPSTTYAVEVCNLADLAGNVGGCTSWTLTTRAEETGGTAPTCRLDRLEPVVTATATRYAPTATAHEPTTYTWDFGNGHTVGPQAVAAATFTYPAPGRYSVILRVANAHGTSQCSAVQLVHTPLTDVAPVSSSSIITTVTRVFVHGSSRNHTDIYVANPDNDSVTRLHWSNTKVWETSVGDNPRTLAVAPSGEIWVANQGSGDISVLNRDGELVRTIDLGYGAAPYGIVFAPDGQAAYVTLEGSGRLLQLDPTDGTTVASLAVGARPRGIAVSGDSARIFVTRFVSTFAESDAAGEVYEVDAATFTVTRTIELAFDPGPDTESGGRGVPNYLSQVRIAPDGGTAWIPSKKDNLARGHYRDGNDLDFETQTRAIVSQIDLTTNAEALDRRIDFNDRDLAQALAFTPVGDAVIVAFQGSNVIEVWDANALTRLSEAPVGRAPDGLAFGPDGRHLYVHNFLDRSVTVLNTAGLLDGTVNEPFVVATVSTVAEEALAPEVLRGKRLFYNAADARMSLDGYLSCASCHLDGGADGMVWDRTQFGEGLRNTIALRGRRGTNGGFVHWTANFDEIQDFEHDMRDAFGGTGFMTDSDFWTGTRDDPLGDPKADLSPELDALAAYVTSLDEYPASPYRQADGTRTAAGHAGRNVFVAQNCATCHAGVDFTDDGQHDVGTLGPASGQGSGAPLTGLNTPTLLGLWLSAPYLHDGSAATLGEVLGNSTHMGSALDAQEKTALAAYLRQIDRQETNLDNPPVLHDDPTRIESYLEHGTAPIATFRATDQDEDPASVTWQVRGEDALSIDEEGVLTFVVSPDYEAPTDADENNIYEVWVGADNGQVRVTRAVTITVQDKNEPPVAKNYSARTWEDTPVRITVLANDTDPDADDTLSIVSVTTPSNGEVTRNADHTLIYYTPAPNFSGSDGFEYTVRDRGGLTDSAKVGVQIYSRNDPPEFEVEEPIRLSVAENTETGQPIGAPVQAVDVDPSDSLRYTLGGTDAGVFAIDHQSGQLTTAAALDYETTNEYQVEVTVDDQAGASDTISVIITVTNENEAPVVWGPTRVRHPEAGRTVQTYTASDPEHDTLTWVLDGADAGKFTLADGVLRFTDPPDFEVPTDADENNRYEVRLTVSDDEGLTSEPLSVQVAVRDAPGELCLSSSASSCRPPAAPRVGQEVHAILDDLDVDENENKTATDLDWAWKGAPDDQWESLCDPGGPCEHTDSYTPQDGDVGRFLRVILTYTDGDGTEKEARVTSDESVTAAPDDSPRPPPSPPGPPSDGPPADGPPSGGPPSGGPPSGGPPSGGPPAEERPDPVGYLENPGADSFQSGIGVISGWVCEAESVEIEIETERGETERHEAAYGTARGDTARRADGTRLCGDTDNGFGLLFNWNLLGDGEHTVVALVDGEELGRAGVTVTTLGAEFLRDVEGECVVEDFPHLGETVTLEWQQNTQNFVIARGARPVGESRAGVADVGYLENPGPNSFQSGIGLISGWVCEAEAVVIEIETAGSEVTRLVAAYGTARGDTARRADGTRLCGDVDNGFGVLFNWNRLGEGEHEVVALVDGAELGRATVRVTTVGVGAEEEFLRDVEGECVVEDFPHLGETVTLEWQQNNQNFAITEVE